MSELKWFPARQQTNKITSSVILLFAGILLTAVDFYLILNKFPSIPIGAYLWILLAQSSYTFSDFFKSIGPGSIFLFFLVWDLSIFNVILLLLFHKRLEKRLIPEYLPCPYCDKSVKLKTDWVCNYCDKAQGEEKYISDKCNYCKRTLNTAFCEHCHNEFRIY